MRTIVHLSDLHFDWIDESLLPELRQAVVDTAPDILAVSGDLTQNARRHEFIDAMEFLRDLPGIPIIVPGNHDMAFLNPWRRATQRLKLFRELVTSDPEPFYSDEEIAVLGLNTARVSHLRNGRIRSWQIKRLEERMAELPAEVLRVLVTHHPFDLPAVFSDREIVGGGREFIPRIVRIADLMLAGHMHVSHAGPTALRYDIGGEAAIFVQAGTALSTRTRAEVNSFQVIRTAPEAIEVQQHLLELGKYTPMNPLLFRRESGTWVAAAHAGSP